MPAFDPAAFIKSFDVKNPDFSSLPENFFQTDTDNLNQQQIIQLGIIKTYYELFHPKIPKSESRVWKSPEGYKYLIQWSNCVLLRILVRILTSSFPPKEFRLKTQLDDAARSTIANIEEGFKRPTTSEYLTFLGYSQASLEEVKGDTKRCQQDNLLPSIPKSSLADLGIDLKKWNLWCQNPLNSPSLLSFPLAKNKGGYRILEEIKGHDLTYEILLELLNKTDWALRRLVESLEHKLDSDQKHYQVEKIRLKSKLKWK